ncbi:MAG: wax ester/triacylglycerol synthase family O-acyltransferase [Pseudomonadales bacterium]|nr:wax ester/triacylglycerol synthase family O-acyltransferase [Pseudomonadales bacterium]
MSRVSWQQGCVPVKKLSLIDDAFLRLESRRMPLHIGGLVVLEPEDSAPEFVTELARKLRQYTKPVGPCRQRLVQKRGVHYWKETNDFDINQHFAHISLPKPGRPKELLAMISRVHSGHLDRAYPLWMFYLIEGFEDGRFAVYFKFHHSVMDGVSMIQMTLKSMSNDREASKSKPAPWAIPLDAKKKHHSPVPSRSRVNVLRAVRSFAREPLRSVRPVLKELRSNWEDLRQHNPDFVVAGHAPRCKFNRQVSASRRFAAQTYSADQIRAVARACGATSNDVVLAMCGGALRRYLIAQDDLPDESLIAGVPVSIRRDNTTLGNEVAFTFANLATHLEDPVARLQAIKRCMDYNKEHLRQLSPDQTIICAALKLAIPATYYAIKEKNKDYALGNICISHVPGPKETMYWQGAKVKGIYPASLLIDGSGLNITLLSRHDGVDVGLVACPRAFPKVQSLLAYLQQELDALTEAAGIQGRAGLRRADASV